MLNARGVQRHMVTVHVDGYYDEPVEVARLLGVRAVQHMPAVGDSVNGGGGHSTSRRRRVTQHYKSALTNTFGSLFPLAEYAIVLEDDLEVSVDFFRYLCFLLRPNGIIIKNKKLLLNFKYLLCGQISIFS